MNKTNIIITILKILILLFILCSIGLSIYVLVNYGNRPLNECPVWVWWLLQNRN